MNFTAATIAPGPAAAFLIRDRVWGGHLNRLVATFSLRQDEEGLHLNLLAVDPGHQRLGYGEEALAEAERRAHALGAAVLLLDTAEVHPWLLDYYRAHGYESYGRAQRQGKTYRSVLFRKAL